MRRLKLEKTQISAGVYRGILRAKTKQDPPPALEILLLGDVVGEVTLIPLEQDGLRWEVRATLPVAHLADGVQTFLIVPSGETEILDRFSIVTGEPLEEDLRAELDLLRAELDMLKRAFRRHCVETLG